MAFSNQSTKLRLLKLLQDSWSSQPNTPVSFSKLAQTLNVSRERVRQLYYQLAVEYTLPPVKKRRPGISEINRQQINDAATKLNRSEDMVRKLRTPRPQTLALEAEVRKYIEQGLSVAEIVRKTGRHVRTIQRIHRRLHLPLPPKRKSPQTLALEAQVRAYREQGMIVPEIAKRTGRNRKTIYVVLRRLHLPYIRVRGRKREKARALEDEVRAFNEQGMIAPEIAKRTGRPVGTIYVVLRRLQLPLPPRRKSPQTLALEAQVRAYREQGMTVAEIARKIGRNSKTVYKIFYRLNIPLRKRRSRPG